MRRSPMLTYGRRGLALLCGALLLAGCERKSAPADEPLEDESTTTSSAPAEPPRPKAMDSKDAPDAPRALPHSHDLPSFVKTEPIKLATPQNMAELIGDKPTAAVLASYHVKRVARCAYKFPTGSARVLLVETATPADAFGAFAVLNKHAGCTVREDGSMRTSTTTDDGLVLSACQGGVLMIATCTIENAKDGPHDCERLVAHTMFSIPAADPPLLARAVREMKAPHCDLWLVRTAKLLAKLDEPTLRKLKPAEVDARLGLDGSAVLSVVSVQPDADAAPVVIWLVEYATPEQAKAAGDRYTQATQPARAGVDKTTFIAASKGRFLVGTWTADQQKAREMVALLEQALSGS